MDRDDEIISALARIEEKIDAAEKDITEIKETYTHLLQFLPVRNIVYGLVGLVLAAVITAVLATVVIDPTTAGTVPGLIGRF